jgi:hypothetical protein
VLDLAGHHGLRHAGTLEQVDAPAQLTERDPVDRRRGRALRQLLELGKRFLLQRDDGDVVAGVARRVEDQKREAAVPRD